MYTAHENLIHDPELLGKDFLTNKAPVLEHGLLGGSGFTPQQGGTQRFDPSKIWGDRCIYYWEADWGIYKLSTSTEIGLLEHQKRLNTTVCKDGELVGGILNRSKSFGISSFWNNNSINTPTYRTNVKKGLPAIEFVSGGSDFLNPTGPASHFIFSGPFEMIFVVRRSANTGVRLPLGCSAGAPFSNPSFVVSNAGLNVCHIFENPFNTTLTAGNDYVLNFSQSGLAGGTGLYINNVKEATTYNAVTWSEANGGFRIGTSDNDGACYDSYMYGMLLVKKFFTTLERESVYKYFSSKYGI